MIVIVELRPNNVNGVAATQNGFLRFFELWMVVVLLLYFHNITYGFDIL